MEGQYFRLFKEELNNGLRVEVRPASLETLTGENVVRFPGKVQKSLSMEETIKMLFSLRDSLPKKQNLYVSYKIPASLLIEFQKEAERLYPKVEEAIPC